MNLYSNWFYIKTFTFETDVTKGEMGYALLTLEAVMTYGLGQKEQLLELSLNGRLLFDTLQTGDLEAFKKVIQESNSDAWKTARNPKGETVLMVASRLGHVPILEMGRNSS